jgi:hypothetical protein
MRTSPLLLLALLAACSSGTQGSSTPAPAPGAGAAEPSASAVCPIAAGTTVLTTDFVASGQRARITLEPGCLYWATTDVAGIRLQLRPRTSGTQMPFIGQLMSGGVQGGSTWEIRPTVRDEYDIWATGAPTGRSVRLTVTVRGTTQPTPR